MSSGTVEVRMMRLNCPVCRAQTGDSILMLQHLMAEHRIGKRRAGFLAAKLVEWKRDGAVLIPRLRMMAGRDVCDESGERSHLSASPREACDTPVPRTPLSV
jgi:hypothetical protein